MKKQVLLFVMMLMPLMASAVEIEGIYYNLNSTKKVAEVTGTENTGDIVIPKTVTYGGVTYFVTSIGDRAFSGCLALTSVNIPNSITSIGDDAFDGCEGFSVHITDLAAWCNIDFYWRTYWAGGIPPECYCSNPLANCSRLFLNGTEVKDLVIPNSVTKINTGAFFGYKGLTSVTIANSVTSIGEGAFLGCSSLTSVNIPNSVTSIGEYAFKGCSGLVSVQIDDISAWCNIYFGHFLDYYYGGELYFYCSSNPLSYARHLYLNGEEVKNLIIPENVTKINSCAFLGFSGNSVSIPNSVTSIGEGAFSGCSNLKSVSIPNSVNKIDFFTFEGCSDLTSITIPNSLTSIGEGAFSGCKKLTSIYISDLATWCQLNGGYQLVSPTCHLFINGVEMNNIKNLVIPNDVTSIRFCAFKNWTGTSVDIGNGVTSIEGQAFYGCSSLTSVSIGNSVSSIGDNVFQGCSVLSSVSIGKGIKSVGVKAFANCPEIKEVYCYAKDVPTINDDTFEDSYYIKWATLYVPESSVELYKASAWSQFGNIVGVTGGNEGERCEKPVITLLANSKIRVVSATEGATCVTNITASNAEPLSDGEISLNTPLIVYTVTSYATKEGYDDSEVATATFRYEKTEGDMNGDGMLNITDVIHLVNMILGQ